MSESSAALPPTAQCIPDTGKMAASRVSVPSQVPGILLRRPDGIKGADGVADAMAQAPPVKPT
jgi:hypothetical protein